MAAPPQARPVRGFTELDPIQATAPFPLLRKLVRLFGTFLSLLVPRLFGIFNLLAALFHFLHRALLWPREALNIFRHDHHPPQVVAAGAPPPPPPPPPPPARGLNAFFFVPNFFRGPALVPPAAPAAHPALPQLRSKIRDLQHGHLNGPPAPVTLVHELRNSFTDAVRNFPGVLRFPVAVAAGLFDASGITLNRLFRAALGARLSLSLVNVATPDFNDGVALRSRVTFQGNLTRPPALAPFAALQVTAEDVLLGLVSKLMYESDWTTQEAARRWGFDAYADLGYNSADVRLPGVYFFNTRAVLLKLGNTVVVAFRGTQPTALVQWLTDGAIRMEAFPGQPQPDAEAPIQVHRGFQAALGLRQVNQPYTDLAHLPLFVQLVLLLNEPQFSEDVEKIYITGHSLGAALANVFAFALKRNDFIADPEVKRRAVAAAARVAGVYTYGTPRQGNAAYADEYDRLYDGIPTHRLINNSDIVCRVPFAALVTFPYVHTKGTRYVVTNPFAVSRLEYADDQPVGGADPDVNFVPLEFTIKSVLDHFPDDYVRHLDFVLASQGPNNLQPPQPVPAPALAPVQPRRP